MGGRSPTIAHIVRLRQKVERLAGAAVELRAAVDDVMGENGHHQELNMLERLKAYGFSVRPDPQPEAFRITLVSDKKKEIRVFRTGAVVRAEAIIGACEAYLEKIFIASKKSWMMNLPEYAEMIGKDMLTGAECRERVTPGDR